MGLTPGTRLGSYEILGPLGAGGMGEVYRARDSRLHREVAIKVLPAGFSADPERLARFEREARVLASLNHPAIAAIYGIEESGGTRFLVLELVEGETLAERVAASPVPVEETLALGRQIAEALGAAHDKGIVHRDLKPANIKVTPSGKVKVLDFGLAKAFAPETQATELSHSPTVTSGGTQHGVVLGTAAYMSPEQARGKPVDRRTDIWSFGCVLYELLTGRRAFEGETVSDVMVSVLSREPDWNALPANTPPRVRELLRRCLRKDPEKRLHDAADARLEIEEPDDAPAITSAVVPRARARPTLAWIAIAIAAAGIGALAAWRMTRRAAGPASSDPVISKLARITHDAGRSEWPAWSADGTLLAYASDRSGNYDIFVRRGDGGQDVNVTNDPGQDIQPAFSPDGNSIAFVSTRSSRTGLVRIGGTLARNVRTFGGDLWVVPALGGAARRLAPDANSPAWKPDGKGIVYVSGLENRRTVMEVPAGGGASRALLAGENATWELNRLACSPDGRWISLEDQIAGIVLMPSGGGKPRMTIPNGFGHAWDGAGRLYFVTTNPQGGTALQMVAIDPDKGTLLGSPRTIGLVTGSLWELTVSADGRRIAASEEEGSRHLTRLPLAPGGGSPSGAEEPLSAGRVKDGYPAISPDNRQVGYISDILGRTELWILDLEKRQRRRLQLPGNDLGQTGPAWLPDGRHIVLSRLLVGNIATNWLVAVDGSGAEELMTRMSTAGSGWLIAPTPDGKRLFYPARNEAGVQQIYVLDLASRKSRQITSGPGNNFDIVLSPDGRTMAVTAVQDGVTQLFRTGIDGGPMQQLTTGYERMRHPFYSPDGKWIYIQPSHRNIYRVPAEGGRLEQVTKFPDAGLFLEEPTISPDGHYLYYCRGSGGSSLWLLTAAGGEPSATTAARASVP